MADVGHRTITEDVYDGSTGSKIEEKVIHQVGITVDGVFVPFLSKEGGWVDGLVAQGKAQQESAQTASEQTPQKQAAAKDPTQQTTEG